MCVPAFIEPPYQNQPKYFQEDPDSDSVEINASMTTCLCPETSTTLKKVAFGVFLHIISGLLYGSYAAYLAFSRTLKYDFHFYIAAGCYFFGICLYLLSVRIYYKVINNSYS